MKFIKFILNSKLFSKLALFLVLITTGVAIKVVPPEGKDLTTQVRASTNAADASANANKLGGAFPLAAIGSAAAAAAAATFGLGRLRTTQSESSKPTPSLKRGIVPPSRSPEPLVVHAVAASKPRGVKPLEELSTLEMIALNALNPPELTFERLREKRQLVKKHDRKGRLE